MINKRTAGSVWEDFTISYLEQNNYKIIEKNFFTRKGEADIIATKGNTLCFIEVKYRMNATYGYAKEAITKTKMKNIIGVARFFLYTHKQYQNYNIRFDVAAIDGINFEYIENAFDAF